MPFPQLHPRTKVVDAARHEFTAALFAIVEKYDLTKVEVSQILTTELQTQLKYMLRRERHPNDLAKRGDEA